MALAECSMNGIMTPVGACDTTQISGCGREKANEIIHEAEPSRPEHTPTIFDRSARPENVVAMTLNIV